MVKLAFFYFALIFAAGFVFGSVRQLVVAPRVGEVAAVLIEGPFILLASFLVASWMLGRFAPDAGADRRLGIGLTAFAMLMSAELIMSWLLGIWPREFVASLFKTPGAIGLAGQVLFAFIPFIVRPRARADEPGPA